MNADDKRRLAEIEHHWFECAAEPGFHYWPHRSAQDDIKFVKCLLDRATAERDAARRICAEAYQAVAVLSYRTGTVDHPDVIRLLDNLAYHDSPPHNDLLPWPKEPLPDLVAERDAAMAALRDLVQQTANKEGGRPHNLLGAYEAARRLLASRPLAAHSAATKPELTK